MLFAHIRIHRAHRPGTSAKGHLLRQNTAKKI